MNQNKNTTFGGHSTNLLIRQFRLDALVEWHRVVFFNRLAEIAGEYLRKGSKVYVEGALRTRKWQDQSGADRYSTEIVASEMQMLDSRGGGSGGSYEQDYPEASGGGFGGSQAAAPAPQAPSAPLGDDDDIPF